MSGAAAKTFVETCGNGDSGVHRRGTAAEKALAALAQKF